MFRILEETRLGYKKVYYKNKVFIVTLEIPKDTLVYFEGDKIPSRVGTLAKMREIGELQIYGGASRNRTDTSDGYGAIKSNYRKCRAERALVLSIVEDCYTSPKFYSRILNDNYLHTDGKPTEYAVGEIVKPASKFSLKEIPCDSGIHFFFDVDDAITY